MVDVARALSGIGAAFKNEIPQFQQRMQQEDLYKMKMADMDMARQDADAKREEARKKTFFQDVAVAKQYFDKGDFGSIADIARDRLNILTPMGVNTRDSQQMLQLADAARAGDTSAIQQLKNQLDTSYSVGQLYGLIPKPTAPDYTTVAAGAGLYDEQGRLVASQPALPAKEVVMQSGTDFDTESRRGSIQNSLGRINETLADSSRIIRTAEDVNQVVRLLGKANLNKVEQAALNKYGLTAANLLNLGPESEAAQALIAQLAPQMRPAGGGATSDFEARQYISAVPSAIQSEGGRELTAMVFDAKAEIEKERIKLENDFVDGKLSTIEYIRANRDLDSKSLFEDPSMRRRMEAIVPNFFGDVQSKIQLRPINPAIGQSLD
jgi:hypothetical protein